MSIEKENEKRWKMHNDALKIWAQQFPLEKERIHEMNEEIKRQSHFRKKIDSYKQKGLYKTDKEEHRVQDFRSQEIMDPKEKYKKLEKIGWGAPRSPFKEINRMQNVNSGGKSRVKSRKYHRRSTRKKSLCRNRKCKKSKCVKK